MEPKVFLRRIIKRGIAVVVITWLYWPLTALFITTGLYDVLRHKNKELGKVFTQYFMVNGTLTWIFSPFNVFIDIVTLPFINKQVYKLEDLPRLHQEEITTILNETPKEYLVNALDELGKANERTMLFYKWYGYNVENNYPCELFHRPFKRVLTIGVSSFGAHSETRPHFGWSRAGVRVLINIDDVVGDDAYLDTNNQRHVWKTDGPLFIFDDTVLHQSVNRTDTARNNLFIDVTRPSMVPWFINGIVKFFGFISTSVPGFNKLSNWKVVK